MKRKSFGKLSLIVITLMSFLLAFGPGLAPAAQGSSSTETINLNRSTVTYESKVKAGDVLKLEWKTSTSDENFAYTVTNISPEFGVSEESVNIESNKEIDTVIYSHQISIKSKDKVSGEVICTIFINIPEDCPPQDYTFKLSELVGEDLTMPKEIAVSIKAKEEFWKPGWWKVSNVSLNGGDNSIKLDPGADVKISLDYQIWDSTNPSAIRQIVIGLEDDAKYCAYNGIPGSKPGVTGSDTHTIKAPGSPGTYGLYARSTQKYTAEDGLKGYEEAFSSRPDRYHRIGEITVAIGKVVNFPDPKS